MDRNNQKLTTVFLKKLYQHLKFAFSEFTLSLPMVSPHTFLLADIFTYHLKQKVVTSSVVKLLIHRYVVEEDIHRYVDVILEWFRETQRQVDMFLNHIATWNPKLNLP